MPPAPMMCGTVDSMVGILHPEVWRGGTQRGAYYPPGYV